MKPGKFAFLTLLITIVLSINNRVDGQSAGREVLNFNFGWKFYKGDISNGQDPNLDDRNWRALNLPHDWSIEGTFSKDYASSTAYLPAGIGWYRKSFKLPATEKNRKVFINFDGIYNNSEVWINGTWLGKRPGKGNLIAVKVDHTKYGDSRWYTGSGIYRDVKLIF